MGSAPLVRRPDAGLLPVLEAGDPEDRPGPNVQKRDARPVRARGEQAEVPVGVSVGRGGDPGREDAGLGRLPGPLPGRQGEGEHVPASGALSLDDLDPAGPVAEERGPGAGPTSHELELGLEAGFVGDGGLGEEPGGVLKKRDSHVEARRSATSGRDLGRHVGTF